MFAKYADKEVLNCLTWSDLLRLKPIFTPYRVPLAPPRKSYWIRLLFTQERLSRRDFCDGAKLRCADLQVTRGGSRGRVQGCAPPPPEMTCGFLIQLVFCKKNYVVYWCWSRARDECTPPKNNPGSAPESHIGQVFTVLRIAFRGALDWLILGIVAWIVGWRQRSHWLTSLW